MRRPGIDIRIVPDLAGPHAAMSGAFVLMTFPHDPPVVYLEQSQSGMFLEDEPELVHYEALFSAVQEVALTGDTSAAFLERMVHTD